MDDASIGGEADRPAFGWAWLIVPLLAAAFGHDLWAPDEPRYAEVAREIFAGGDAIVMHLNGEVYPDKPPLLYWLAGSLGAASGWNVGAMRLVSVASVLATAWIVARFARRLWGEREARWAPVVYLSTVMSLWHGARMQIDPLLGALTTASLYVASGAPLDAADARRRARWSGLLCGLAVLAKGPVAFVFVLLPQLVWRWTLGPRGGARARLSWLEAGACALALPAAWAAAAIAKEPELARPLLFGQHVGRALEGVSHARPFWYHFKEQPPMLLPWTLAVIAAFALAWRERARRRAGADHDASLLRCAYWFAVLFLFFSVITEKRDLYLMPAVPAAALMVTRWLVVAMQAPSRSARWVTYPTAGLLAVAGLALAAGPWLEPLFGARFEHVPDDEMPHFGWRLAAVGIPMLGLALAALAAAARGSIRRWAMATVACFATTVTLAALLLFPRVDPVKSARAMALYLASRPERPAAIPCQGIQPEGLRFYGGVPAAREPFDVAFARDGADLLALMEESNWRRLPDAQREQLVVVHRQVVGSARILVVGRKPAGR